MQLKVTIYRLNSDSGLSPSVVTHQTAPGSPEGGAGAAVVSVTLTGVNQRLLPGHPRTRRPQGGAGPRDGGQRPHAAIVHGEASPAWLWLLK